jgi:hypothetical protein
MMLHRPVERTQIYFRTAKINLSPFSRHLFPRGVNEALEHEALVEFLNVW